MNTPAWKDAPDVAGDWAHKQWRRRMRVVEISPVTLKHYAENPPSANSRYYGPIPEDKNE